MTTPRACHPADAPVLLGRLGARDPMSAFRVERRDPPACPANQACGGPLFDRRPRGTRYGGQADPRVAKRASRHVRIPCWSPAERPTAATGMATIGLPRQYRPARAVARPDRANGHRDRCLVCMHSVLVAASAAPRLAGLRPRSTFAALPALSPVDFGRAKISERGDRLPDPLAVSPAASGQSPDLHQCLHSVLVDDRSRADASVRRCPASRSSQAASFIANRVDRSKRPG